MANPEIHIQMIVDADLRSSVQVIGGNSEQSARLDELTQEQQIELEKKVDQNLTEPGVSIEYEK
jgi:hypothetical protein